MRSTITEAIAAGMTLTEALAELGLSHRKSCRGLYCREILRGDEVVHTGTSRETWAWLRSTGRIVGDGKQ